MNKNKGFIGIGLIIAIVLGIAVVGGGAYYLGKSSKVENKEVLENNLETNQNLPVYNNQQVNTTTSTNPSITVLSPNGGETFATSTTIKQIPVTWKSSGITSKNVAFYIKNMSTGVEEPNGIYPDNGSTNIYGIPAGIYKIRICSTNQKNGNFEVTYDPDCGTASDYSDNSFTINSSNTTVSTTLPAPYISAQEGWVPVIKNSSNTYSCNVGKGNPDSDEQTVQKIISGKTYCIHSSDEGAAGTIYHTYTYTTANGSATKTTTFILRYMGCGGLDSSQSQCYSIQKKFSDTDLDIMIASLM